MSESDSDKLLRTVSAVIGAARESVRDELPLDWQQRVAERAVNFASAAQPSRLNIFLFHQSVSGQAETINTVDIKGLYHSRFYYDQ